MNKIDYLQCDIKGGREYFGETKNMKEHGIGFYNIDIFKQKFVGEFIDGKAHGLGLKIQGPGRDWQRTIVCEYDENDHVGMGAYKWANGAKYIGTYKNGVAKGPGMFITHEGLKYIGNFSLDDDIVGVKNIGMKGADYWIRGDGKWYNQKDEEIDITQYGYDIHGFKRIYNKEIWPNGTWYEGQFDDNNLYSGFGRYWYSATRYYEGEFKDGFFHGYGLDYYDENNYMEGQFVNGECCGFAKAHFDNGSYVGYFKKNRFHGEGKFIYKDKVYDGFFYNIVTKGEGEGMDTGFTSK